MRRLIRLLTIAQRTPSSRRARESGGHPTRSLGHYSDRREHAAVVALSKSGRRLFIELAGDVLSTNVAGHVFGER